MDNLFCKIFGVVAFIALLPLTVMATKSEESKNRIVNILLGDTAEVYTPEEVVDNLTALAVGTDINGEAAAALSILLRGENNLGHKALQVIVDESDSRSDVVMAISQYLIDWAAESDSSAEQMQIELERMCGYLERTDSIAPDVFIALAESYIHGGEADRAEYYLSRVLDKRAEMSSDQLQRIAIAYMLITGADYKKPYKSNKWLLTALSALCLMAMGATVFCFMRRRKPIDRIDCGDCSAAAREVAKEMLSISIVAMERNRELMLLAERKITAGQTKELYASLNSGTYQAQTVEMYFKAFDAAFQKCYPTFFEKLNELLLPDKRVTIESGILSPELRICALVSLGADNSQTLAELMGLSVNTIYAYRNRMKGRAIDRTNFEDNLRELPTISG